MEGPIQKYIFVISMWTVKTIHTIILHKTNSKEIYKKKYIFRAHFRLSFLVRNILLQIPIFILYIRMFVRLSICLKRVFDGSNYPDFIICPFVYKRFVSPSFDGVF